MKMNSELEKALCLYNKLKKIYVGDLAGINAHVNNVYWGNEDAILIDEWRPTKATYFTCLYYLSCDIEDEYMLEHGYRRTGRDDIKTWKKNDENC